MKPITDSTTCQLVPRLDPLPHIVIRHGITLLTGSPNVGKSAMLAGLAQRFRDQLPIFGHQPNKVPEIGIVVTDRKWEQGAGLWFERAGFPEIKVYSLADDPFFDPRTLRRKFERTARWAEFVDRLKLPGGSLLFTDPIGLFLGGNLNDYDTCGVAIHEMRALIRQRDLSVIATAHTAKLKADPRDRYLRLQDQILGSTALLGFSDTQMYLAAPEETGRQTYTFCWAPHMAPPESFEMERTSTGLFIPARKGLDREGNLQRVLDLLPQDGGPVTLAQLVNLARTYPLSDKTVRRALDELVQRGRVERVGRGLYRRSPLQP